MEFKRGDYVVFPLHGAGIIAEIEKQNVDGREVSFYRIEFPYGNLQLKVPTRNAGKTGLRPVISSDEVHKVLDYIKSSTVKPQDANWNKRQREQLEQMKSGDIYKTVEVFKYLAGREKSKALSSGEKKMLVSAKKILYSEIQLASGASKEEVESMVERCLT